MKLVLMGVCGSGKTTLAHKVAEYLGCGPVIEADTYHSPEMKEKMRSGVPLTDEDRWPWIDRINDALVKEQHPWCVATCSALRRSYRDRLRKTIEDDVYFILLDAPREVLRERLRKRHHEYMPDTLLDSQLATLEAPGLGEPIATVSVAASENEALDAIIDIISKYQDPCRGRASRSHGDER